LVRSAAKDLSAAGLVGDFSGETSNMSSSIDSSGSGGGGGSSKNGGSGGSGSGLAAVLQNQVDALLQSGESFLVEVGEIRNSTQRTRNMNHAHTHIHVFFLCIRFVIWFSFFLYKDFSALYVYIYTMPLVIG